MEMFHTNKQFNPYGIDDNHKNGYFVTEEPYSTEKKIEIAAMIEKYGLLTSLASKTLITKKIAAEGKVSVCFVEKIFNRIGLARHKSQHLGRGTHSLSEADEHCLVYLYRQHPFRDVQSYVDNLYLITGTLAHSSAIFNFFKPLQVFVPSFSSPGGSIHAHHGQDENFPRGDEEKMEQDEPPFSSKLAISVPKQDKMPDLSMISSFSRCGIAPSRINNKKRTMPCTPIRGHDNHDCNRPRVRRRFDFQGFSEGYSTFEESSAKPVSTSLVVYQPPSFSAGMIVPKPSSLVVAHPPSPNPAYLVSRPIHQPSAWVPRPPPAEYRCSGNPQVP